MRKKVKQAQSFEITGERNRVKYRITALEKPNGGVWATIVVESSVQDENVLRNICYAMQCCAMDAFERRDRANLRE